MSSAIPAILDEITRRLNTIPDVAAVERVLEGRSAEAEPLAANYPIIALRIASDSISTAKDGKARVALTLNLDALVLADASFTDATLANLLYAIRKAIGVDESPALAGLLRANTGVEWQTATYGYPDPGSNIAGVRQPLILNLIETY